MSIQGRVNLGPDSRWKSGPPLVQNQIIVASEPVSNILWQAVVMLIHELRDGENRQISSPILDGIPRGGFEMPPSDVHALCINAEIGFRHNAVDRQGKSHVVIWQPSPISGDGVGCLVATHDSHNLDSWHLILRAFMLIYCLGATIITPPYPNVNLRLVDRQVPVSAVPNSPKHYETRSR